MALRRCYDFLAEIRVRVSACDEPASGVTQRASKRRRSISDLQHESRWGADAKTPERSQNPFGSRVELLDEHSGGTAGVQLVDDHHQQRRKPSVLSQVINEPADRYAAPLIQPEPPLTPALCVR